MNTRYTTTITVTIQYDAATTADAYNVAERLEASLTVAQPTGRGAELTRIASRTKVAA